MLDSQSMFFKVREVILEQACSMKTTTCSSKVGSENSADFD